MTSHRFEKSAVSESLDNMRQEDASKYRHEHGVISAKNEDDNVVGAMIACSPNHTSQHSEKYPSRQRSPGRHETDDTVSTETGSTNEAVNDEMSAHYLIQLDTTTSQTDSIEEQSVDLERGGRCVCFVADEKLTNIENESDHQASIPSSTLAPANENTASQSQWKRRMPPAVHAWCLLVNPSFVRELTRFKILKISQIILSVYIMVFTFTEIGGLRNEETGLFIDQESEERTQKGLLLVNGDERAIIATSTFQVACFGLARLSSWFMYPTLVFVFLSKFRATTSFLSRSPAAMHMYSDSHELHVYCGWTIVLCSLVHTGCHVARWAAQGNLQLLVTNITGVTGLVIIVSCLLICLPMTLFRKQIKYEIRKRLHYLFIPFAGALALHTPKSAVPNGGFVAYVFGTLLVWYFLDATYCFFFMTEKIVTTKFAVLPSGVRMTMNVSERFQKAGAKGGICYVCLPWISKHQWHAFSLFENPSNPAERQIFIQKTGDWTSNLHRCAQRNTVRPAWVHGPFPTPYDRAEAYDNQILVASGIGITPALSAIQAHKDSRRINLIWVIRDPHLLDFFVKNFYFNHEGWNLIFYTGKEKLSTHHIDIVTNTNVCIVEGRPNLHEVIPNIIFGIESGRGLPENYTPTTRAAASELLADRRVELNTEHQTTPRIEAESDYLLISRTAVAKNLARLASELGFHSPSEEIRRNADVLMPDDSTSKNKSITTTGLLEQEQRMESSKDLLGRLTLKFRPWEDTTLLTDGAKEYVKGLDRQSILRTWGILYCGGSKKILADLNQISEEYRISLHVESFEW